MFGHLQGSFCPCCPTKYSKMIETFACSVAQGPGFSNIYWVSFSISLQSHSCGVYYIYYTYHTRKSWARSQHVLRKSGFAQLCCWPPWILEGQLENMTCSCFAVATSVQKALIRTLSKTSSGFLMYFQPKEEPKKLKVNLGLLWSIEDFLCINIESCQCTETMSQQTLSPLNTHLEKKQCGRKPVAMTKCGLEEPTA